MKIANDKQLKKILNGKIRVPIYYTENPSDNGTIAEGIITMDEEAMREEFERLLSDLVDAIHNY